MRVLVTRPEPGLERSCATLAALGHTPLALPLSRIETLTAGVREAAASDAEILIVTSASAVRAVAGKFATDRTVFAVGEATAEAARQAGFSMVHAGPGTGAELARLLAAGKAPIKRHLYLAGRVRSPDLEAGLREKGVPLDVVEVYDTIAVDYDRTALQARLGNAPCEAALFYSAFAARSFARLTEIHRPEQFAVTRLCCLSENVAAALGETGGRTVRIAAKPDESALLHLLDA